eukprot:jgi/Mesvir1/17464/Mv08735-RA.1
MENLGPELTEEEKNAVRSLRAATVNIKGVEKFSMLDLAQYYIISKDVAKAIDRIAHVIAFERQYAEGRHLQDLSITNPVNVAILSSFIRPAGRDHEGRTVLFLDYASFHPRKFETPEQWTDLVQAIMVWCSAACSDIEEVRRGCVVVVNMEGFGWSNFSLEMERRAAILYQDGLPLRLKAIYLLRPPLLVHAVIAACKVFLKQKLRERLCLVRSLEALHAFVPPESLPTCIGGTYNEYDTLEAWVAARGEVRRKALLDCEAAVNKEASDRS